ncbi:MAG: hypothetical protein HY601_02730 [Candidatus Omnitrophica bacterium]|nr:hypothetical protein [Candidatus Omnitrophota bacterium]
MRFTPRAVLPWLEAQVHACRPLALRYFRSNRLAVSRKSDDSPVTAADRAVEERLRQALRRAFPGDPILGEEFGSSRRLGSTYWTIDPIDGTRAFSRKLPHWGILIGKVEEGLPVLGLCDFPALDLTVAVAPGVAAYERQGRTVRRFPRARPAPALAQAILFHGGLRWWPRRPLGGLIRLLRACYFEQVYGDCYAYVLALRGQADAVIDYGVKPWDMVPVAALAAATGRVLTDHAGRPCHTGPESVFGHPILVRTICRALRAGA